MPIEDYLIPLKQELENPNYFKLDNNCKLWLLNKTNNYGIIILRSSGNRKDFYVHRLALCFKFNLSYFDDFVTRHSCEHKHCYNEDHLDIGSQKDNMQDWSKTITHCPQGHEYSEENTAFRPQVKNEVTYVGKFCRTCEREKASIYYQQNKEKVKQYQREYRAQLRQEREFDKWEKS